ncbi:MAG: hypothetical protein OJI67_10410 [Prosthecobacter sp.]|nr:hypothetical protein [Prosthecobacter sp.]
MKIASFVVAIGLLLPLAGCAGMEGAGHKYVMRGQILEVSGDATYLCVGTNDGAKVGQELGVYKYTKQPSHPKLQARKFKKEKTGVVQITEIMDEHMATAKIISGQAKQNYIVELAP